LKQIERQHERRGEEDKRFEIVAKFSTAFPSVSLHPPREHKWKRHAPYNVSAQGHRSSHFDERKSKEGKPKAKRWRDHSTQPFGPKLGRAVACFHRVSETEIPDTVKRYREKF